MNVSEIDNIKFGTMFKYSLFSAVKFVGTDEKHVILQDKNGNVKKIYKNLFAAHATPHVIK